jgi:apolipoprotein N-acyltransferase
MTSLAMVGFGGISGLAYPRIEFWPAIFISVAGITWLLRRLTLASSLSLGFLGGAAFYVSQIYWISQYLGPAPLIGLATLEAIIFAVGSVAITITWRLLDAWSSNFATWLTPVALANVWLLREWVSTNFPYGGFPWARLGMSQSNSAFANFAYLGGIPLISWVVAFISACLILVLSRARTRDLRTTMHRLSPIAVLAFAAVLIHPPVASETGSLRIAAVQGNANAGLFANPLPGSILQKHLRASALIAQNPTSPKPELVVWPENSVDVNPAANATAAIELDRLVTERLGVPLILGTIVERNGEYFNQSQLWMPGRGAVDYYDKKRPVPFAEYVPDRDFWYSLAPDLIGLISHGYSFGTRDGIYDVASTKVGVNICFEIAIDDINHDLVAAGAAVLVSQTNNSDFGHSDETFQQAAIAKLRAIETGRVVVNDSTVGVTVAYAPDGSIIKQLKPFEPGVIEFDAPLRTSLTPAFWFAPAMVWLTNFIALGQLIASLALAVKRRSRIRAKNEEDSA